MIREIAEANGETFNQTGLQKIAEKEAAEAAKKKQEAEAKKQ